MYPVYISVGKDNIIDGNDDTNTVVYLLYTCVDEDDIDVVGGSDDTISTVYFC